jgi:hypothetical protein
MERLIIKKISNVFPIENIETIETYFKTFPEKGSAGHGAALNFLIDRIDTQYGAIFDADCPPLMKGWDQILIDMLDDHVKIAGTSAVETQFRTTTFPLMFACLFDAATFKSLGIDMRPGDISKGQDTGWEMEQKFLDAGYGGRILEGKSTRKYTDGPFGEIVGCDEYYYGGKIFCCHLGRGSNRAYVIHKDTGLPLVLCKRKAMKQTRRWMEICREIVGDEGKI